MSWNVTIAAHAWRIVVASRRHQHPPIHTSARELTLVIEEHISDDMEITRLLENVAVAQIDATHLGEQGIANLAHRSSVQCPSLTPEQPMLKIVLLAFIHPFGVYFLATSIFFGLLSTVDETVQPPPSMSAEFGIEPGDGSSTSLTAVTRSAGSPSPAMLPAYPGHRFAPDR